MSMNWILSPLGLYSMMAAAMMACLALFIAVKIEMSRLNRRSRATGEAVSSRLDEAESAVEHLRKEVSEAGERAPAGPTPAMNLTRRSQALRMRQHGEAPATIAAALRAPRNEIELLIKIQEIQRQASQRI